MSFPDVAAVVRDVLLPLLGVKDLISLASTSRELKGLVYESPETVWEAAAR